MHISVVVKTVPARLKSKIKQQIIHNVLSPTNLGGLQSTSTNEETTLLGRKHVIFGEISVDKFASLHPAKFNDQGLVAM